MSHPAPVSFAVAAACALCSAGAAQVRVIYSNIASSPTSDVPGMPGVKFHAGATTQFDRPALSPDGSRWIFVAVNNGATATDEMVIVGGGATAATATAAVVAQEGTPTPWDASISYGIFGTYVCINNAGRFAFAADTTAATTADQVVVAGTVGSLAVVAREGDPAAGQPAVFGYGSAADAVHILNDGTVAFRSAALTGATTQQVLYRGETIVAQTDVTSPTGQLAAPDQLIDNLAAGRYSSDPTGAHVIYAGDLNGPTGTDLFMVVDGAVRAQEGAPLPGSSFTSNVTTVSGDAGSQRINSAGQYIFRGGNADTIDWVCVNGSVAAQTDAPITPAASESYDDATFAATFFMSTINGHGDFVIGGTTNAPDVSANAVLVLNGQRVIARENDPVDLDGNGQNDDNLFISVFNNDDAVLTDGLVYYFFADLRDGAGAAAGQAFLSIDLNPASCPGDLGSQGGVPGPDGQKDNNDFVVFIDLFFAHDPRADVGQQGGVAGSDNQWDNNDFVVFIDQFFTPC